MTASARLDLTVSGMTCASCVRRVERALAEVPGVQQASVNLVTERATVLVDPALTTLSSLLAVVQDAGYDATDASAESGTGAAAAEARARRLADDEDAHTAGLRRDLILAASLTAPLLVLAMSHGAIPGTDGPWVPWVQLALATPVVFGPGRRFFRLAWASPEIAGASGRASRAASLSATCRCRSLTWLATAGREGPAAAAATDPRGCSA